MPLETDALGSISREALEALPVAAYVCDEAGGVVAWNAEADALLRFSCALAPDETGRGPAAPRGSPGERRLAVDGTELAREDTAIGRALASGAAVRGLVYALGWAGVPRVFVREAARPLRAPDGRVTGALCLCEPLDDAAAFDLAKSAGLSRQLGIVVSDMHGRIVEANDEYLRIVGYSRDDLASGRFRWDRCTVPEHLIRDHVAIEEALRTGHCQPYEKDYVRKDGVRVPVLIGYALMRARLNQFIVYVVDLTALRGAERHVRDAMEGAGTGTWDYTLETDEVLWSPRSAELMGVAAEAAPGPLAAFVALVHPGDREAVARAVEQSVAGKRPYQVEYRPASDPERWLLARGAVFADYEGRPARLSGTLIDISERKRAEELLRRALATRNEFLAVASHELRTPITSIELQAERLLRRCGEDGGDPVVADALQRIVRQVARIDALVDDMLTVTRAATSKLELERSRVDVVELLEGCIGRLRERRDPAFAALRLELPAGARAGVPAEWDARRMERVFENLICNAVKFGQGRPVEVALELIEGVARIEVRDHGVGIAPAEQERIFLPFTRATPGVPFAGLGIGLYLVREIVRAHGGRISVASAPGEGATFRIELPLAVEPSDALPRAASAR